jgi:hypothetical protein
MRTTTDRSHGSALEWETTRYVAALCAFSSTYLCLPRLQALPTRYGRCLRYQIAPSSKFDEQNQSRFNEAVPIWSSPDLGEPDICSVLQCQYVTVHRNPEARPWSCDYIIQVPKYSTRFSPMHSSDEPSRSPASACSRTTLYNAQSRRFVESSSELCVEPNLASLPEGFLSESLNDVSISSGLHSALCTGIAKSVPLSHSVSDAHIRRSRSRRSLLLWPCCGPNSMQSPV